jgi:putative transposase
MNIPTHMPRLKGFRYPREVIAYAVWSFHRLALSTADVEDLLAARGVIVSREAIRLWVNRFGRHFADCIRRDRPRANDKWHLDDALPGRVCVHTREGRDHDPRQETLAVARD